MPRSHAGHERRRSARHSTARSRSGCTVVPPVLSVGDRWQTALDEHARIVDAIRARDEPTARTLASGHMSTAREIRLTLLREAATNG